MVKILNTMIRIFALILLTGVITLASCSNEQMYKEYRIADLSKELSDTLEMQTPEFVNSIEVVIKGNIKGKAILEFQNGPGPYSKLKLEGVVNQVYRTDWYQKKCHFIYKPLSDIKGDYLVLEYRIY